MKTYKIIVEYDGTDYYGFQRQKKHPSIQSELEKALSFVLNEPIRIVSSGRTDSGVHARGHVVSFSTNSDIERKNMLSGLNAALPNDISVKRVIRVGDDFHAQYDAKRKSYRYHVWNSPVPSPLRSRYSYQYTYELDIEKIKKAAKLFVGKHDFRAFAAKSRDKENTVRRIYDVRVSKKGNNISFTLEGDGFLYNMVRNIVGTLLYVGRGKFTEADVKTILRTKTRSLAGPTAPAKGLMLMRVIY